MYAYPANEYENFIIVRENLFIVLNYYQNYQIHYDRSIQKNICIFKSRQFL